MQKRMYHIPMTDIVSVVTTEMMQFPMAGSPSHGQADAPARREPGDMKSY